jgi:hypothetical protein
MVGQRPQVLAELIETCRFVLGELKTLDANRQVEALREDVKEVQARAGSQLNELRSAKANPVPPPWSL